MARLPRIAVGTTQEDADGTAMLWALMDAVAAAGVRVQSFLSRAYFAPRDGATATTGQPPRHLDSWIMCRQACRESFLRGCGASELAIVEGTFASGASDDRPQGGSLSTLCDWLDLARVAIVDVRRLGECQLPPRPPCLDGLLLDGVRDSGDACRWVTQLEAVWNVRVLGWLGDVPELRRQIEAIPPGGRPSVELCRALGHELARTTNLERIYRLAADRPECPCGQPRAACCRSALQKPLQVAVACDAAFGGYFPDTLDLLEARGATLCDFSPLRDDRLPAGTDLVYLGCGHPERFAEQLATNDCMMLSLKSHLCSGRRIYAECGGLAYLCHEIEMPDGHRWPMAGALPVTARYHETTAHPTPAELTLVADTWLGPSPVRCRGYLTPHWSIAKHNAPSCCAAEGEHQRDVLHRHRAIGSRLYVNFAAHEGLLDRFFQPHHRASAMTGPANR